ncbi:polo-like kinase 3 [Balamuthia mandrillaris]
MGWFSKLKAGKKEKKKHTKKNKKKQQHDEEERATTREQQVAADKKKKQDGNAANELHPLHKGEPPEPLQDNSLLAQADCWSSAWPRRALSYASFGSCYTSHERVEDDFLGCDSIIFSALAPSGPSSSVEGSERLLVRESYEMAPRTNAASARLAQLRWELRVLDRCREHPCFAQLVEVLEVIDEGQQAVPKRDKHKVLLVLRSLRTQPDSRLLFDFLVDLSEQPMEPEEQEALVKPLFWKLLCAVDHLHRQGLAPLHLKPTNITIRPSRSPNSEEPSKDRNIDTKQKGWNKEIRSGCKCWDLELNHLETVLLSEVYDQVPTTAGSTANVDYVAPEILVSEPDLDLRKVNMWQLGALLYTMLLLTPPFSSFSNCMSINKIFHNIIGAKFNQDEHYEKLSREARNILGDGLLRKDPKERWTLPQLMQHEWFGGLRDELFERPNVPSLLDLCLRRVYALVADDPETWGEAVTEKTPVDIKERVMEEAMLRNEEKRWWKLYLAQLENYGLLT